LIRKLLQQRLLISYKFPVQASNLNHKTTTKTTQALESRGF